MFIPVLRGIADISSLVNRECLEKLQKIATEGLPLVIQGAVTEGHKKENWLCNCILSNS